MAVGLDLRPLQQVFLPCRLFEARTCLAVLACPYAGGHWSWGCAVDDCWTGTVHSEMPKVTDLEGSLWGFQLWINLPKKDKRVEPRYQDYQATDILVVQEGSVRVQVVAGTHGGTTGPIEMRNPGLLMGVTLTKGSTFLQEFSDLLPPVMSDLLQSSQGRDVMLAFAQLLNLAR